MTTLLSILVILASILLTAVVFIQNPKGGGLSSDFGSATQIGGIQKTNDVIEKTTEELIQEKEAQLLALYDELKALRGE